jgi:CRISPR-associated protein Cas1
LELDSVNLLGPVQLTAQAQAALMRAQIPICHFTHGGWFTGMTTGLGMANVDLRRAQYRAADDPAHSLRLAQEFIRGKVKNQRTLLRRSLGQTATLDLRRLQLLLKALPRTRDLNHVLGLEGAAARIWFRRLPEVLESTRSDKELLTNFSTRNRRPPLDPVNAMLSYGYGILVKELSVILERAGFDSRLGFMHRPRGGRPALALDLMEEFRPLVVDSVVLGLVARGEIDSGDFLRCGDAVSLTQPGRRKVLSAYERRLDTLIQHPVFGYTISYRRVLDVQARLLGRHLLGEVESYTSFTTR